ncbi:hypothetical protein BD779DRAFT_150663 [Infundibulicybe gibba]|nr:hypothetical protein BD779DRAFT_150663 [Infundibulicybe gibba]
MSPGSELSPESPTLPSTLAAARDTHDLTTVNPQGAQQQPWVGRPETNRLQLNANANTFVPMPRPEITIRWPDGTPADLVELKMAAAKNRAQPIHFNGRQCSFRVDNAGPRRMPAVRAETGEPGKKRARRGCVGSVAEGGNENTHSLCQRHSQWGLLHPCKWL